MSPLYKGSSGNGHEASGRFPFYILTTLCSVALGKSPGLSAFLCTFVCCELAQPLVVGECLLCACLEQHTHSLWSTAAQPGGAQVRRLRLQLMRVSAGVGPARPLTASLLQTVSCLLRGRCAECITECFAERSPFCLVPRAPREPRSHVFSRRELVTRPGLESNQVKA